MKPKPTVTNDFDVVTLKLASPERILQWSHGEITRPETINYRTQRSEKQGLFDEKIFGPERDYECYCGKYRGVRYRGIVCEKCGVEVTRSIVRRERMGHIELASPVSHIWFLKNMPSRIALILGIGAMDLEKVIYFAGYIITKVFTEERDKFIKELEAEFKSKVKGSQDDKTHQALKELMQGARKEIESLVPGKVLDETAFHRFGVRYGTLFEAKIGAEAVYDILKATDLKKLEEQLTAQLTKAGGPEKEKLNRRLGLIRAMIDSGIRPEWMFLTRIPVTPPGLRPMVALEGGRFATSDINDLYRRVINRNNRLMKLKEIHAPDVILRNEKRILQEAVDALIDASMRQGSSQSASLAQGQKRALKSLSDSLKGKHGLFRQNLLGKRVDYSGRSVIVVGPTMKLDECGLPKLMALELFKPFVINGLLKKELAFNIRGATRLIEEGVADVWAILENVIKDKYVLLNRAPTLHRQSIQAFRPVLVEGNAIQVHPMVCTGFNADFDGDMMAVHVPLSKEAQMEAKEIMASNKNILKPGSGEPTFVGKLLDIVLGVFWMTRVVPGAKGEGKFFEDEASAKLAFDYGHLSYRASIKLLAPDSPKYKEYAGTLFETTLGRILFNQVLPADYPFVNKELDRKKMAAMIDDLIIRYGVDEIPNILDKVKAFGFNSVTYSGITWGIDDIKIPKGRDAAIEQGRKNAAVITSQFNDGLLSEEEMNRNTQQIWHNVKSDVEKMIPGALDKYGPVYDMITSGSRGSYGQITQMAGMKGLIQNAAGQIIPLPILSCSLEGYSPLEYFITTNGARKGLTDTALNTARAGYLTRKLFVVAQDMMISQHDCGTKEGVLVTDTNALGIKMPISKSVRGRVLAEDCVNKEGKVLFKKGHLISKQDSVAIEEGGVTSIHTFSPMTCKSVKGICAKCYGIDLGRNAMVDVGEAVGTVAAQAIGEPGTQLTMRTFHIGGAAAQGGDIVAGLPRVEELFEKRRPKNPAVIATVSGTVSSVKNTGSEKLITIVPELEDRGKGGEIEYSAHARRVPVVKVGDKVNKGDFLTDGSADVDELFEYAGSEKAREYVITEVSKIYELQGEPVSRKHIEVIIRQMFSRLEVVHPGDTKLVEGEVITREDYVEANAEAKANGGTEAKVKEAVMGITETSLSRKSFLAAASFQHTNRVLINTAVRGGVDNLHGLMENVIIGRLIPAGSGFKGSAKHEMIEQVRRGYANRPATDNQG